ncbi:TPA: hypothetical protein ACH1PF_004856 [Enterobacter cloacae]
MINLAMKVISIRSFITKAILSINVTADNYHLNENIKKSVIRSCNTVNHIAEAISGDFIKPNILIQDLLSAKYLIDLFANELVHVSLNVPTKNEIDVLIKEIQEMN